MTTIATTTVTPGPTRAQDRTGRALMAILAAITAVVFVDALRRLPGVDEDMLLTDFWRAFGYVVFGGMAVLLAIAPRKQRGMWELLLVHKIAVTAQALFVLSVPNAGLTAAIDGFVVLLTLTAYVLCRGWISWRPGQLGPDDNR